MGEIRNMHGWAGGMQKTKEQMIPTSNKISDHSFPRVLFLSEYRKYTSWDNFHNINLLNTVYYSEHFYIYSLIWNLHL